MSADLFIVEGTESEYVTKQTNTADIATPIMEISPDRGLFLRFLNRVAKGDDPGIPVYATLRDSGDNDLRGDVVRVFDVEEAETERTDSAVEQLLADSGRRVGR